VNSTSDDDGIEYPVPLLHYDYVPYFAMLLHRILHVPVVSDTYQRAKQYVTSLIK
jgi:hypothetical protein